MYYLADFTKMTLGTLERNIAPFITRGKRVIIPKNQSGVVDLPPRVMIFNEQTELSHLFLLDKGLIRVGFNDPNGNERTAALLEPGSSFGEDVLLKEPTQFLAETVTECRIKYIAKPHIKQALFKESSHPDVPDNLEHILSKTLRRTINNRFISNELSAYQTLAKVLFLIAVNSPELRNSPSSELFINHTRPYLSALANLSREEVCGQVNRLNAEGLASGLKGPNVGIIIHDLEGLRRKFNPG